MPGKKIEPMYCPTCLRVLRQVIGTGYDNYGWCEHCNVWKKGEQ